jgi:hypothetical protein
MTDNDAIVSELLRATDDRDWGRVLGLMGEHAVTRSSFGRIYVGRAGFEDWLRETSASTTARHFEIATVRDLDRGYVLVIGTEQRNLIRGIPEAIPGAWIYHVEDGRVNACMYFRTKRDALASVAGPGRDEPLVDVLERCVDAFNRDDYDDLVGLLDERLRFRPVLIGQDVTEEGIEAFTDALVAVRVRFDDVLVERIAVDEIGDGYAIATTTVRAVDDGEVVRRRLAHAVRVVDGRVREWLPFARVEAARIAVASRVGGVLP